MELSEEDKNRIRLEEMYRQEVAAGLKGKSRVSLMETIIKVLQGLSIIAGIWATVFAYQKISDEKRQQTKTEIQQREQQIEQAKKEFRKGFYEKQLDLYLEAVTATAILSTEPIGSEAYNTARKSFYRLYWGRLSFVEDKCVESKMVNFKDMLAIYEKKSADTLILPDKCSDTSVILIGVNQDALQHASLRLAHAARMHILENWLSAEEKDRYNK